MLDSAALLKEEQTPDNRIASHGLVCPKIEVRTSSGSSDKLIFKI
jgi:hypothetical protein